MAWSFLEKMKEAGSQRLSGPRVVDNSDALSVTERFVIGLMLSVVFLLPFSRLAELPMLVLSLMGLWQWGRSFRRLESQCRMTDGLRDFWASPAVRILTLVYLAYLGMVLVSAPDSYWGDKTWQVGLASVRFWLSGVAVLTLVRSPQAVALLVRGGAWIAAFWALDALFQYFSGVNLLGRGTDPLRLSGIFGAGHVKLGPVLAFLLPFYLAGSRRWPSVMRWFVTVVIFMVIGLTGTRSAWLMAVFAGMAWWWRYRPGKYWRSMGLIGLVSGAVILSLWQFSPAFHQRVQRSMQVLQGGLQGVDYALSDRLPIWEAGWRMFTEHPLNGVGARAFRKAYPEYAPTGNVWQRQGGTAMHAHHWLLEILAETGLAGLVLFLGAAFGFWRWLRCCGVNEYNWPFVLSLLVMFLPFVSTYSLFSSFWGLCIWWVGTGTLLATGITGREGRRPESREKTANA